MSEATYGNGAAADRRRWLHKRLTEMRDGDELPTTVSSLYYDGVQHSRWPSDAEVKAAGGKRTPRQDVSDAVQWLIERDLVDGDAIVDISRGVLDHRRPDDLREATYTYAETVELSPWPADVPACIVESRSLSAALDGVAGRYGIALAPLSGMSGRTFLRSDVVGIITVHSPIGYLGDWNPAGFDIERNVSRTLLELGWRGEWTKLALTDDDAAGLPRIIKHDNRHRPPLAYESVEAEALTTTVLRRRLTDWLTELLPEGFDWAEHEARTRTQRAGLLALLGDEAPGGC